VPRPQQLLGSGAAVLFARVFSLICAAIQLPLLTRVLPPGNYAMVAVAIAIAAYFSFIAEPVVLSFERYPGSIDDRAIYRYTLTRSLFLMVSAAAVLLALAYPLGYLNEAIAFVGWGIGFEVNRVISFAWLMWQRPWQYAINLVAGTGVRTAVLLLLIVIGWNPLLSLGAAGLASAFAALLISPRVSLSRIPMERATPPWRASFGIHLAVAALAYTILTNGNLLVLTAFVAKPLVGRYAVMMQVSTLTSAAILGVILAVAYPPLRLAWDNGRRRSVHDALTVLQTACIAIASTVILVAYVADHFLLKLFIPSVYVDSAVLAPLIMATAFATMGGMASWHHQLGFHSGLVARRTVVASAIGIALTVLLTAIFQERGAATGALMGFLIYLVMMQRGTGLPPRTVALAFVSLSVACSPLANAISPNLVALGALTLAAAAVFISLKSHRLFRPR
jgi:O-antigen/teichoic acid export membrane protein